MLWKPSVFTLISLINETPCKPNCKMFLKTLYTISSASMIPCHELFAFHPENSFSAKSQRNDILIIAESSKTDVRL